MTETPKRPARTPAQRRADLRARAVTLLMEDEAALLQAADSLVIEAMLHAYRRKLTYAFEALSGELMRRMTTAESTRTGGKTGGLRPPVLDVPVTVTAKNRFGPPVV